MRLENAWRKVRTPTGSRLDNVQARQRDGKCNRKIPPVGRVERLRTLFQVSEFQVSSSRNALTLKLETLKLETAS
jgi:hypothetical protein